MRYPTKRIVYNKRVAKARVNNIHKILIKPGFNVITYLIERKGNDIEVFDEWDNIVLVVEVTNWRSSSNMGDKKVQSVNSCLLTEECKRLLIISHMSNIIKVKHRIDSSIEILELGDQTQSFYKFYHKKGQAAGMRPNNYHTKKSTRLLFTQKLKQMGLL